MDGDVFGPYSAKSMLELDVLPDIMVTEATIDTWQPAGNFDFAALAKQEVLERLKSSSNNDSGSEASIVLQKRDALKARLKNNGNLNIAGKSQPEVMPPSISFPEVIEYKANFNDGMLAIGGKIIITPSQLIFRAHKVNIGDLRDRIYEIGQITGYEKGMLTYLYISFQNGERIKLNVWSKTEIIEQLEARRLALQK